MRGGKVTIRKSNQCGDERLKKLRDGKLAKGKRILRESSNELSWQRRTIPPPRNRLLLGEYCRRRPTFLEYESNLKL